jgi:hypothetical protein
LREITRDHTRVRMSEILDDDDDEDDEDMASLIGIATSTEEDTGREIIRRKKDR